MSALVHLRCLAGGQRSADDGLLGNTRCIWGGTEILSEEAILASFVANPFSLDGDLHEVETSQGAAIIGDEGAMFADLYEGRIGRLWRVGRSLGRPAEPAVDVAFDPDMHQAGGALGFRAEDHPCLDAEASQILIAATERLTQQLQRGGMLRVRAFVLRAWGNDDSSAALVALHTMSGDPSRSASFRLAGIGAGVPVGSDRFVVDPPPSRAWTPRL